MKRQRKGATLLWRWSANRYEPCQWWTAGDIDRYAVRHQPEAGKLSSLNGQNEPLKSVKAVRLSQEVGLDVVAQGGGVLRCE